MSTARSEHRFEEFEVLTALHRSDFRDTGPVLAFLLGAGFSYEIRDLALVDYAEALHAVRPSWVAGALVSVKRASREFASDPARLTRELV